MAKNGKGHAAGNFTVPGIGAEDAATIAGILQQRLTALTDLALTLKHIHWNVVGPQFIGVHLMLDPQVKKVNKMVDEIAERIATLGHSPVGTPGALVEARTWDDYSLGRADAIAHLGALDLVYKGIIEAHRQALYNLDKYDLVTQDLLLGQAEKLEQFHWFVRAHLENAAGDLKTTGAHTEQEAAGKSKS